jgi:hypothetical protein
VPKVTCRLGIARLLADSSRPIARWPGSSPKLLPASDD